MGRIETGRRLEVGKAPGQGKVFFGIGHILPHGHDRLDAGGLRPGQLVVLESTTYPGTTEEVILPLLEEQGFTVGKDFFLAISPERVDPGNPTFNTVNIPKVVGGVTPECTEVARNLYGQVMETVVPVSSVRVAETVKLLENTFRSVNIGLVNEIALMCSAMDIDVWEVIEGAATKPFGFMPFYPGPGLGGHCIPIDPFYLTWKARQYGVDTRFIELAGEVNRAMPAYVVSKVEQALAVQGRALAGSRVLVLGIAYKKNVDDMRESPAAEILQLLDEAGAYAGTAVPLPIEVDPATAPPNPATLEIRQEVATGQRLQRVVAAGQRGGRVVAVGTTVVRSL